MFLSVFSLKGGRFKTSRARWTRAVTLRTANLHQTISQAQARTIIAVTRCKMTANCPQQRTALHQTAPTLMPLDQVTTRVVILLVKDKDKAHSHKDHQARPDNP